VEKAALQGNGKEFWLFMPKPVDVHFMQFWPSAAP
jgi:hypothetical protein